jgi:hypothetical protein
MDLKHQSLLFHPRLQFLLCPLPHLFLQPRLFLQFRQSQFRPCPLSHHQDQSHQLDLSDQLGRPLQSRLPLLWYPLDLKPQSHLCHQRRLFLRYPPYLRLDLFHQSALSDQPPQSLQHHPSILSPPFHHPGPSHP